MISLLLHESEVKLRTSAIIQMYLGYNLLISLRTVSFNAFFYTLTSNGFWLRSTIKVFFVQ